MSIAIPTGGGSGLKLSPVNVRNINTTNTYTTPSSGMDYFDGTSSNYQSFARQKTTELNRTALYLSKRNAIPAQEGTSTGMPNEFVITTTKPSILFLEPDWLYVKAQTLYKTTGSNQPTRSDRVAYHINYNGAKIFADGYEVLDATSSGGNGWGHVSLGDKGTYQYFGNVSSNSSIRSQKSFNAINVVNSGDYYESTFSMDENVGIFYNTASSVASLNGQNYNDEALGNNIGLPFIPFNDNILLRFSIEIALDLAPIVGSTTYTLDTFTLNTTTFRFKAKVLELE